MKNKISLIYFTIAIALAAVIFVVANTTKTIAPIPKQDLVKSASTFKQSNGNLIVVDTFIQLINTAYKGLATVTTNNKTLLVSVSNANAMTKDFFNGNDNLLIYKLADVGFEIKYNATQQTVAAQFAIQNNAVFVPNDVLIKIMDKTSNAKNTMH